LASNQRRILTTHVGSLVRPPSLIAFLEEIEAGRPYDEFAHSACLKESVADVVRQQAEAGVDIVSDGEFGKTGNWARYIQPVYPEPDIRIQGTASYTGRDQRSSDDNEYGPRLCRVPGILR
jgi:hypothetical protein